jgi:hypothetical protein
MAIKYIGLPVPADGRKSVRQGAESAHQSRCPSAAANIAWGYLTTPLQLQANHQECTGSPAQPNDEKEKQRLSLQNIICDREEQGKKQQYTLGHDKLKEENNQPDKSLRQSDSWLHM